MTRVLNSMPKILLECYLTDDIQNGKSCNLVPTGSDLHFINCAQGKDKDGLKSCKKEA